MTCSNFLLRLHRFTFEWTYISGHFLAWSLFTRYWIREHRATIVLWCRPILRRTCATVATTPVGWQFPDGPLKARDAADKNWFSGESLSDGSSSDIYPKFPWKVTKSGTTSMWCRCRRNIIVETCNKDIHKQRREFVGAERADVTVLRTNHRTSLVHSQKAWHRSEIAA